MLVIPLSITLIQPGTSDCETAPLKMTLVSPFTTHMSLCYSLIGMSMKKMTKTAHRLQRLLL